MKRFVTTALVAVTVGVVFANVADAQKPIKRLVSERGHMLNLTNDLRRENGKWRLYQSPKLNEIAQGYATLMAKVDTKNIIIDYSPLQALGASWAVSFASHDRLNDRQNAAFALWAKSSRDRANMLNRRFFYMGSGYAISKSGKCYYCIVLASSSGVPPGPPTNGG
jgi:uncharacterized protein YkwD